jgi:endonuclease YncB( thermonuclease family)
MIKGGHAWAARAYLKRATGTQYCAWEAAARAAKRGLWGLPQDDWIYPPDWRRIERGTTDYYDDYADETVARCVAAIGRR